MTSEVRNSGENYPLVHSRLTDFYISPEALEDILAWDGSIPTYPSPQVRTKDERDQDDYRIRKVMDERWRMLSERWMHAINRGTE